MSPNEFLVEKAFILCKKFMYKVETGKAKSKETYEDCKNFIKMYEELKKEKNDKISN